MIRSSFEALARRGDLGCNEAGSFSSFFSFLSLPRGETISIDGGGAAPRGDLTRSTPATEVDAVGLLEAVMAASSMEGGI